jgi:hypothetical protein
MTRETTQKKGRPAALPMEILQTNLVIPIVCVFFTIFAGYFSKQYNYVA